MPQAASQVSVKQCSKCCPHRRAQAGRGYSSVIGVPDNLVHLCREPSGLNCMRTRLIDNNESVLELFMSSGPVLKLAAHLH